MPKRTSLSEQIAAELRKSILSGELGPQGALPSERDLINRYGTSKNTVHNAITILKSEGLITARFGRGTYVRDRPPIRRVSAARRHAAHRSAGKPIFDVLAVEQGQVPSRRILFIGRDKAPPSSAQWLQANPNDEVAIRKRLQLLDGHPAVISTSYYPLWLAADTRLESPDALPEGPDELIEALGHRFIRGIEVFRARMPTPDERRLLDLHPGVPVVDMWDVDYDAEGRTLQVAHDIYAADRHEFTYDWTEEDIRR